MVEAAVSNFYWNSGSDVDAVLPREGQKEPHVEVYYARASANMSKRSVKILSLLSYRHLFPELASISSTRGRALRVF